MALYLCVSRIDDYAIAKTPYPIYLYTRRGRYVRATVRSAINSPPFNRKYVAQRVSDGSSCILQTTRGQATAVQICCVFQEQKGAVPLNTFQPVAG